MTIKISEVFPTLSKRQREICALVLKGKSTKEIARDLEMSPGTVGGHRDYIFKKVGVTCVAGLAHKAYGSPEVMA